MCTSNNNSAANYTWYKKNNETQLSKEPQLTLSSIQPSDSGEYYCTAENELGRRTSTFVFIGVKYAPKLPSVSVSPSAEIVEGSSVTLTCNSDANPAAKYTWYKNQTQLSKEPQLTFSSIQPSDSGEYYCIAENKLGTSTPEYISLGVKYAPKLPSVSVSPSAEIVEGSSVTLTCSSDANPAATYSWYKRNNQTPVSKYSQLTFSSIWPSDSGKYYCTAENKLGTSAPKYISVNVTYAPKLPSVSVSPSAEIVEGSSVTLTCSSDANPAANYTWYKEDEDSPKASGQSFTITDFRSEHSGSYFCEVQNTRGRHNSTLKLKAVAGTWTMVSLMVPAILLIILLALVLIFLILWFIASKQQIPEPVERPDDSEELWPTEDDIVYASVHFSKHQADHVYTQIRPSLTKSHRKEKEEEAEMLTFRSASTTPGNQEAADPAPLYD
uniref:Ig-like domain-containing protein n=2 Tax=Oreochromis aureus TaxID=47969 RepID=A0AAZ1Y1K9_OREAU